MENNIGFNTMINNFSNKLIQDIKDSQLPVSIVYLVMKDVFTNIQNVYEETLRTELEQSKDNSETTEEQEK